MEYAHHHIERKQGNQHRCNYVLQISGTLRSPDICEGNIDHQHIRRCHLRDKREDIVDEIAEPQRKQPAGHRVAKPEPPAADKSDNIIPRCLLHINISPSGFWHHGHKFCK